MPSPRILQHWHYRAEETARPLAIFCPFFLRKRQILSRGFLNGRAGAWPLLGSTPIAPADMRHLN
jgi:hypothetical protein